MIKGKAPQVFIAEDSNELPIDELNTKLDNILNKLKVLMTLMETCTVEKDENNEN